MSRLGFDDVDERPDLTEIADHLCVGFARLVFIIEGVLEGLNLRVIERLNSELCWKSFQSCFFEKYQSV